MTEIPNPQEETTSSKRSSRVSYLPGADLEIRDAAQRMLPYWKAANLPLAWMTPAQFEKIVKEYGDDLLMRQNSGAERRPLTSEFSEIDKEINERVTNLKNYLIDAYGRVKAPDYYAEFGIEKIGNSLTLPRDRNQRREALKKVLVAIPKHQLDTQRYGLAYWQDIQTRYEKLHEQAIQIDGTVSAKVQRKNELKEQIRDVLQSIIYLLKAHYPQAYKAKMREWGFQKEKY